MKNSEKIIIKTFKPYHESMVNYVSDYEKKIRSKKTNAIRKVTFFPAKKTNLTFRIEQKALFEHSTIEKFSLTRLKALQWYLTDILETWNLDQETRKWYELNYKRINTILKGEGGEHFCDNEYVYIIMRYKTTVNSGVGRLYAQRGFSYTYLPREIRGILIDKEYKDFDIGNAHPSLMLDYAISQMKIQPENLHFYVVNKNQFISEIADKFSFGKDFVKTTLLKALNSTNSDILRLIEDSKLKDSDFAKFLMDFYNEIVVIREDIYDKCFIKNSFFRDYIESKKGFSEKSLDRKKVTIQSMYCQSMETYHVYDLIRALQEKVLERMKDNSFNVGWHQIEHLLDRPIEIDEREFFLTCIPVYDGLFIGSEDGVTKLAIENMVEEHNKKLSLHGSFVKFHQKDLDRDTKKIDSELFRLYYNVLMFLQSCSQAEMHKIIKLVNIKDLSFIGCENLEDMMHHAAEFRRALIKALIEFQELHNVGFDDNYISKLTEVHKERLKKYKKSDDFLRSLEEDIGEEYSTNDNDDEFGREEVNRFIVAYKDVAQKEINYKTEELTAMLESFSSIAARVPEVEREYSNTHNNVKYPDEYEYYDDPSHDDPYNE